MGKLIFFKVKSKATTFLHYHAFECTGHKAWIKIYLSGVYFIRGSFMLHLQFSRNLHGVKKSCEDSPVLTRLFDRFAPDLFYAVESHSGQLMITHISDALTC